MRKIFPIVLVGLLVLSGLGAAAIINNTIPDIKTEAKSEMITTTFSTPIIKKGDNDYIEVNLKDASSYLMNPGQPMLPKVVKSFELPFGVKNVKVGVITKNIQECEINGEIRPAPTPLPLIATTDGINIESRKDEKTYTSADPFPSEWFDYRVGCGLNADNKRVTFVSINIFPVKYAPALNKAYVAESADIEITYEQPEPTSLLKDTSYNLVIIAPSKFAKELQRLVNHKNSFGVKTVLKTTEDIFKEYTGVDKPEQIKYFIKDTIEKWNVTYVLLVGGVKSAISSKPRDDTNQGTKDWYVPVRYHNFFDNPEHPLSGETIHDPGVISDLYYADIYKEGGEFENWDPNGDGIFAAWGRPGVENDTGIDFYPDVSLGRLACTSEREVKDVVDKIIKYEKSPADPSWFKKTVVISGDGFLDQEDLNITWDTKGLPDGKYTIYGQSKNKVDVYGPIDVIHVTLDRSVESNISFNHDDNLKIKSYPFNPIAEITSPSDGNILGNTDYFFSPGDGKAYCNSFNGWANVEYKDGIMHIRGKSYDPEPYGNVTSIHVFVENESGQIVFSDWRNDTEMYYEGECVTGDKLLNGGGGALYYMPSDFKKDIVWTSNGKLTDQQDVVDALSKGCGFAFFSGHGNPNLWADHFPGVPGNRAHGSVTGLFVISASYGAPFLPMNRLSNTDKLPVILVGGCHNSQFNVSLASTFLDKKNTGYMWTYGYFVPECFSWYLVKLPRRGAIATIGNTGLGYGILGKDCTIGGLDGGICIEFFKQYGTEGHHILGDAYTQTLRNYATTFDMENLDHAKSLTQWVLLGDPSLMIGGYS
jgi:hypothetical protein